MMTKTEKLMKMDMTLKETNELAKELYEEYDLLKTIIWEQLDLLDVMSKEYHTLGNKWCALSDLNNILYELSVAGRRSERMKLDLIARVADVERQGITLI